jgi:hypothetical protein
MSERNKRFRSHCNFKVSLNKENNTVTVEAGYKQELFEEPKTMYRYGYGDIVEELARQGLIVDSNPSRQLVSLVLDNYSFKTEKHNINVAIGLVTNSETSTNKPVVKKRVPQKAHKTKTEKLNK